jgi:hypothetical protein
MKHTVERLTPAENPESTPKASGVSSAPVQAAPNVEDDAAVWRDPATAPVSPPPVEAPVRETAPRQPTSDQQADQPPPRQRTQPIPSRPRSTGTVSPRRAARRTRVVVRKVGPLSVLKFSLIFYFCVMLIIYLALLIIWVVLSAAGGIDALARLLGQVFPPNATTGEAPPLQIDGQQVFTWLFVMGVAFALIWSVINVFVAFLYNLISDLVGGVEVTLAEKPSR